MAIDVYLQIDGIKGESADEAHTGWIECTTINFGVSQPKSATASTGGGHTAERVDVKDILFSKQADLSRRYCSNPARAERPYLKPLSSSCVPTPMARGLNTSLSN